MGWNNEVEHGMETMSTLLCVKCLAYLSSHTSTHYKAVVADTLSSAVGGACITSRPALFQGDMVH